MIRNRPSLFHPPRPPLPDTNHSPIRSPHLQLRTSQKMENVRGMRRPQRTHPNPQLRKPADHPRLPRLHPRRGHPLARAGSGTPFPRSPRHPRRHVLGPSLAGPERGCQAALRIFPRRAPTPSAQSSLLPRLPSRRRPHRPWLNLRLVSSRSPQQSLPAFHRAPHAACHRGFLLLSITLPPRPHRFAR